MKKYFLIFTICLFGMVFNSYAGYLIRGNSITAKEYNLKNYTLTFDHKNIPIAAASYGTGSLCTGIIVVREDSQAITYFDILLGDEQEIADRHIEVRDFHYVKQADCYVLCGTRGIGKRGPRAFIARMDMSFTQLWFHEFPYADIFYSIGGVFDGIANIAPANVNLYACGAKKDKGTIVEFNLGSLAVSNQIITDIEWEYHKIIRKENVIIEDKFYPAVLVVSGKNPKCTLSGLTIIEENLIGTWNYYFPDQTIPGSLCTVADYHPKTTSESRSTVILATSLSDQIKLYLFNLSSPGAVGYTFSYLYKSAYHVQDIYCDSKGISIVGQTSPTLSSYYGYVSHPLNANSVLYSNSFFESLSDFRFYKVKPDTKGEINAAGMFFGISPIAPLSVLFSDPQNYSVCDHNEKIGCIATKLKLDKFVLSMPEYKNSKAPVFYAKGMIFPYVKECYLKAEDEVAEVVGETGNDFQIINNTDHLTLKGVPFNTTYYIYGIDGRLLQNGVTGSTIPIGNLPKGIYILKLDNGENYKFVK